MSELFNRGSWPQGLGFSASDGKCHHLGTSPHPCRDRASDSPNTTFNAHLPAPEEPVVIPVSSTHPTILTEVSFTSTQPCLKQQAMAERNSTSHLFLPSFNPNPRKKICYIQRAESRQASSPTNTSVDPKGQNLNPSLREGEDPEVEGRF